jgi:hypothetical protein
MTNENRNQDRDAVLLAFHEACERPTADQIIAWVEKYPKFAEDIRAYATVTWDWITQGEAAAEADESLLATAYSKALSIVWQADNAAVSETPVAARSFHDLLAARGMGLPQLARAIGMKRGIVGDLVSGRMRGPIRGVFVNAVSAALAIGRDAFQGAHVLALRSPTLGPAKADGAPSIVVRSYEEIIRTSDELTDEEKRYWLEEQ